MRLEGSIDIARPLLDVFDFIADPQNDPKWCERVEWCIQTEGDGPAPGARYEALHQPSGYPWAHLRQIEVLECEPPRYIRWRQADRVGVFDIVYELVPIERGTRLTQRDEVAWRLPLSSLVGERIVRRHIAEQHEALRSLLEGSALERAASVR